MGWVEHTDEYHYRWRRWWIESVHWRLQMRAGVLAGHAVTIRFTASVAFFECSCGINGPLRPHASHARMDGVEHLGRAGAAVLQRIRHCGIDADDGLWTCHGDDAGTYCLFDGILTNCDGRLIGACDCPCGHGRTT
jgi:hypothetical protein